MRKLVCRQQRPRQHQHLPLLPSHLRVTSPGAKKIGKAAFFFLLCRPLHFFGCLKFSCYIDCCSMLHVRMFDFSCCHVPEKLAAVMLGMLLRSCSLHLEPFRLCVAASEVFHQNVLREPSLRFFRAEFFSRVSFWAEFSFARSQHG